jgi:hypothetical protein
VCLGQPFKASFKSTFDKYVPCMKCSAGVAYMFRGTLGYTAICLSKIILFSTGLVYMFSPGIVNRYLKKVRYL